MIDTLISLIGNVPDGTTDEFAQPVTSETKTEVLAVSVPVSRSEYYNAGQLGIKPEYLFVIHPAEYHGEQEIEICGPVPHRARVYRVYERNADELELYCQASAGLNERPELEPAESSETEDPET